MRRTFRQTIIDYFSFLRSDRSGVITLIILILFAATGHVVVSRMDFVPGTDFTEAKKALESWNYQNELSKNLILFEFDPNTVSEEQLDCLDVPVLIKRNLVKYRAAGGKIKNPADFRRIYGMNDSLFASLEPFIHIKQNVTKPVGKEVYQVNKKELPAFSKPRGVIAAEDNAAALDSTHAGERLPGKESLFIELNSADSAELTKLYGIGPVFASRIIKYRNLLGGYYSPAQLREVYGLREETMMLIQDYVFADTALIKPLRVNFDNYRDLLRHPYLEKHHVEAILNYRSQNGPYTSIGQILQNGVMDSVVFAGIKPYLTCR
jgi:DNA uptake protein ComE-like DNA-binding protein